MDRRLVIKLITSTVFTFALLAGCSNNSSTDDGEIVVVLPNTAPSTGAASETSSVIGTETSIDTTTNTSADQVTGTSTEPSTDNSTNTDASIETDIDAGTDTETDTTTDTDTSTLANDQSANRQISAANAESILREVSAIVNEKPLKDFMKQWQRTFSGGGPWIEFSTSRPNQTSETIIQIADRGELAEPVRLNYVNDNEESEFDFATEFTDYTCTGGGTIRGLSAPKAYTHILDNCASSSGTFSGEVLFVRFGDLSGYVGVGQYKNLKLVDAQQVESTLSGRHKDSSGLIETGLGYTPEWKDVDFNSTQNNEPFTLTNFNSYRDESRVATIPGTEYAFSASIKADFEVAASWTQQETLSVSVDVSLNTVGPELRSAEWETGSLSVNALDGSWMTIEFDAANTLEFSIMLENNEVIGPYRWKDGYLLWLSRHW